MKYFTCLLLIFCIFTISECKGINFPNPKHSYLSNLTITTQHHLTTTNLKGSSSDVDIDSVDICKNCKSCKYCADGYAKIKNAYRYELLACGFSHDEPTEDDILGFVLYEVSSKVKIDVCTDDDADYFSCFACDNFDCSGKMIKLSMSTGAIVGIVIGIILFLLVCAGCCFGIYKYKNKNLNSNIRVG